MPSAETVFALRARKVLIILFWSVFSQFWFPVVTLVAFSSNLSNFVRNSWKPKKIPKKIQNLLNKKKHKIKQIYKKISKNKSKKSIKQTHKSKKIQKISEKIKKSKKKISKSFFLNKSEYFENIFHWTKISYFISYVKSVICLRPELSSPAHFRIQGGRRTEQEILVSNIGYI